MKLFSITGIVCTLIVSVTLTSCKKAPYMSLNTPSAIEFAFNGGQGEIVFSTNRPWTASNTGDWCTLPQTSGEGGECSIPVVIAPNPDFDPRMCTVSVSTEAGSFEVTVRQGRRPTVIPASDRIELAWNDNAFTISTKFNEPYVIRIEGDWLASTDTRALSLGQESFIAESNRSLSPRTATVYLENEGMSSRIQVIQGGYTHAVMEENEPGFYGFSFGDIVYTPGHHQIGVARYPGSASFRILGPDDGIIAEVSGLSADLKPEDSFQGGVSIIRDMSMAFSFAGQMLVLKTSDNLIWLAVNDKSGIIARI